MIIYYILSIFATVVLLITAPEHLIFNKGSIYVLLFIGLMIFLSRHFKNNKTDKDFNSTYGSNFNEKQQKKLYDLLAISFKISTPLCFPFVFFLIEWKKIVAVGIIFVVAFLAGPTLFRLKYGKATKTRLDNEKQELDEQTIKEKEDKI